MLSIGKAGLTLDSLVLKEFRIPIIVTAVSNIIFNSLLIIALKKTNSLQTISHKYIFILSISDTLYSVFQLMMQACFPRIPENWIMVIYYGATKVYYQFSVFLVVSIGIDRYAHMKFLIKYPTVFTEKRAKVLVVMIIFLSLTLTVIYIYEILRQGEMFIPVLFYNLTISVSIITLCLLYWRAYKSVETRTRQMNLGNEKEAGSREHQEIEANATTVVNHPNRRNPTREFARAVFFILGCLILCNLPSIFASIVAAKQFPNTSKTAKFVKYGFNVLLFFNATLNAIIVLMFNRRVKKYVQGLFKKLMKVASNESQ